MEEIKNEVGRKRHEAGKYEVAGKLFASMSTGTEEFSGNIPEFLTPPAYEHLIEEGR